MYVHTHSAHTHTNTCTHTHTCTHIHKQTQSEQPKRVEDVFLGQNAALVDLNALLAAPPTAVNPNNPFLVQIQYMYSRG